MKHFHHSFVTDPEDVARYLEALIEGFKGGVLEFSSQERSLRLTPTKVLEMSIETGARRGRMRLSINISWPEDSPRHRGHERGFGQLDY
jgi:amphi-Trp domain-containing protein